MTHPLHFKQRLTNYTNTTDYTNSSFYITVFRVTFLITRICTPSAGFEPPIPGIEWPQSYGLDRAATGIGHFFLLPLLIPSSLPILPSFLLVLLLLPPPLPPQLYSLHYHIEIFKKLQRYESFPLSLRHFAAYNCYSCHSPPSLKKQHTHRFFVSYLDHVKIQCAVLTVHDKPPLIPCYDPVCSVYMASHH